MTFLNKKLARRTVLKGLGTTLALPFLDAMAPALGAQSAAKPVRRFQAFYTPNGMAMDYWTPKTELELHSCGRLEFVSDRHENRRQNRD